MRLPIDSSCLEGALMVCCFRRRHALLVLFPKKTCTAVSTVWLEQCEKDVLQI
mgnify:CR=1 FL=1